MSRPPAIAVWLALAGCAAHRPTLGEAEVRRIAFDGNQGFFTDRSDASLRLAMTHPAPTFRPWPFRRRVGLDRARLDADRSRVLTYLAHRGYFDADLDWRVVERRPGDDRRTAVVDVVGELSLGPVTTVTAITVAGLGALPPGVQRRTRRSVTGKDEPFLLETHDANLAALKRTLQTLGYPSPQATGEVQVRRADRSVSLAYEVEAGPRADLRDIDVEGLADVPRAAVMRRLHLEPGDRYDVSALEGAKSRLYGMDVFSIVSVTAKATDDPGLVDVVVQVEERPPRSVAVRGGVEIQSGRQEALVGLELLHVNALHRLWRVHLDAEGGGAVVGSELGQILKTGLSLAELRTGPVADVALDLSVPNAPLDGVDTTVKVGFEHTITEAFQTNRPSVAASSTFTPHRTTKVSLGYRLDFVQYVDLQVDPADLQAAGAARDVIDGEYRNAYVQSRLVWDTRNDPLSPTKGHVVDLTADVAGTWLGGSYDYTGLQLDLRAYRGLGRRFDRLRRALGLRRDALVFAGRLGGGLLAPYGPPARAQVPVAERLYLGGTGSVRGWTYQHLGPYVCQATEAPCTFAYGSPVEEGVDTVPIGGRVATWGSLEVRRSFEYVRLVAFVDAGMVWPTVAEILDRRPLLSAGGGVRLLTPVGPIRLDVAVRLDDPPEFMVQEPRAWVHLGLGEAF